MEQESDDFQLIEMALIVIDQIDHNNIYDIYEIYRKKDEANNVLLVGKYFVENEFVIVSSAGLQETLSWYLKIIYKMHRKVDLYKNCGVSISVLQSKLFLN